MPLMLILKFYVVVRNTKGRPCFKKKSFEPSLDVIICLRIYSVFYLHVTSGLKSHHKEYR